MAETVERYRKKDMLQTVDTLLRANDAIVKTARSNPEGAAEALVQCQESAIALGTYIDTLGEKHAILVHVLEDYCENIYQMNESLSDENTCRKVSKKIQKQLTGLQNNIRYDLPEDRKEIVFLPYKASMWDSLESVWKAADADPDCDAYVIPIPYFDKNPDGSFKEEHYEGDQYPAYVPITPYDAYDLETRRPDVIYIHNPYDECNHVTSVHPYFYSKNLRNFTDKLVYIPYFTLKEIEPDNKIAVDSMKHFCFTPGTIYAHQVIVQSENMRQIYINEYIKAAKEMGLGGEHVERKFLEKKFLGTGSPKIDRILNTKKEDLEIPAEWLKVIEKPDGSWKKVVFYNISVSALLQHSEKMLRKIESVFEIFKENKDEVTLLWRPHPLIQATIESMRPELWEEYKEIRDQYISEGWGIYDDSADVDRAVVISDMYYGDMSSVMQLCQKAGRRVVLQNINMLERFVEKREYIHNRGGDIGEDVVWDGEKIWFCTQYFNSLFCMDIISDEIKFLGEFPDEKYGSERLYVSMKLVKGKIYFIPFSAKAIAVYDIEKKEFSKILIDEKKIGCKLETNFLFMGVEEYRNYLIILPATCRAIIRLNVDNQEIDYITNWFTKIEQNIFNNTCSFFRRQVVIQKDKLYVPFCNANAVLELDCDTLDSKIYKLGKEEIGYSGICHDGNDFYLSPIESGDLYKWNLENNSITKIEIYKESAIRNSYAYVGVLNIGNKILLFPSNHEDGVVKDRDIKNVEIQKGAFSFAKEEKGYDAFYEMEKGVLTIVKRENSQSIMVEIMSDRVKVDIEKLLKSHQDYIFEIPGASITNMIAMIEKECI